jgi:hypothetical protein
MSEHDTPQGPTDPHGVGGADAPAPPGGPQRTDSPAGLETPGEPAQDPGPAAPSAGSDIPPAHGDERELGDDERSLQEENAGTSLDEPSDGSGGE